MNNREMKIFQTIFVLLALLNVGKCSQVIVAESDSTLKDLVHDLRLRLHEMSLESSEQIEQLLAVQQLLWQSVDRLSWIIGGVDDRLKVVQNDQRSVMENLARITSQSELMMVNQQFCANHDALRDLYFELNPRCQGSSLSPVTTETIPTQETPSSTTPESTSTTPERTSSTTSTSPKPTTSSTTLDSPTSSTTPSPAPIINFSCKNAPSSGVYSIVMRNGAIVEAFCEATTHGGGWLVFQSRTDGTVDFNRSWTDYRNGFGSARGEHWLGLEYLAELTAVECELLIEMEDFGGNAAYGRYNYFKVEHATDRYRLRLGTIFTGTAGDAMGRYFDESFATYDVEGGNYPHCAEMLASGFWHYDCSSSVYRNNLNGIYGYGKGQQGIWWGTFNGAVNQNRTPLKTVRMMIREMYP